MNTNLAIEPEALSDASLVDLSLSGDREAFGQIVARYQSPICALAYSACGNFGRSEDIAQEVFVAAWRRLGGLRERTKFKAWLYGIARNLINNTFRQNARNPLADAEMLEMTEPARLEDEPDNLAISKEEETILWHVLSGLPQIFREPMVLYYRQHESIRQVADVLEISEEAARQRLSRGREMLNERVTRVIQSGLRRSGPAECFTLGVIAALPVLGVITAKGAVVGVMATESAKGPAAGTAAVLKALGVFVAILAVPAAFGALFGRQLGQDEKGLPQRHESLRRFLRVFVIGIGMLAFLPLVLTLALGGLFHGEARAQFLSIMKYWMALAYPFVLGAIVYWAWRRRGQPAAGAEVQGLEAKPVARKLPRLVLFLTLGAAALLAFCLLDTNYNVGNLNATELRDLVTQNPAKNLDVSIMQGPNRTLIGDSPGIYRNFWIELRKDGHTAKYTAEVTDEAVKLLAQKGVACPTHIAGRDYEVLGAPGRLLPLLAAFVLATGGIFIWKRRQAST